MPVDVLIVGQGLAGSLLAWELIRQQVRVMVIDSGETNASQVAAGLINPITGKRLVRTAEIERLLPAAMDCYQQLALAFNQQFFVPIPMLRLLKSEQERHIAKQRLAQAEYQAFLTDGPSSAPDIISAFGMLQQMQTGYLKTRQLLKRLRDFFVANDCYQQIRMNYHEIVFQPRLQWQDLQPRHIVFCEGHQATINPWFGGLPFQPVKGEILRCKTHAVSPARILNFGYWMIPTEPHQFRLGATFDYNNLDTQPTEHASNQLIQALTEVYPGLQPVEIVEHQAGIRPATLDKQPFIGSHPVYHQLHIFNGFGAKGSLAIPWYAQQFAAALNQGASIPDAVHVRRYYDSYFPSA
ncbi:NAD(P)/FAD-dependent oxidoreductase [Nitrosomonas communis]|uniref:Glycine/D-amino acid oxidase n=1 Tax=Nitrosomonas communis TaxID=44574 RepID=A0A1I4KEX9_9PROT|nr:FAD-binding oxidoreductase [Nitrosomonas communis]SFL77209.1 Glycine/D-amino acid oxidase [Nitrosomonas communis]